MKVIGHGRIYWIDDAHGNDAKNPIREWAPDYRGTVTIDQKKYRIDGWRDGGHDGGQKYVRISIIDPQAHAMSQHESKIEP